jgi:hypothetical protein
LYWTKKWRLQNKLSLTNTNNSQSAPNQGGTQPKNIFWLCLAVGGGIILIGLIGYLAGRNQNFSQSNRRRKI